MTRIQRVDLGFRYLMQSFSFIWNHPIIWSYIPLLTIPIFIKIYLERLNEIHSLLPQLPEISEHLSIMILPAIGVFIATFGVSCIIIHAFALLDQKPASFGLTLQTFAPRAIHITVWALILALAIYLDLRITATMPLYFQDTEWTSWLVSGAYNIIKIALWLLTFFVIPVLVLETHSFLTSLERAFSLSVKLFIEIIGGELALICAGMLAVVLLPLGMLALYIEGPLRIIIMGIALIPVLILFMLITGAMPVFQAKLYHYYSRELS